VYKTLVTPSTPLTDLLSFARRSLSSGRAIAAPDAALGLGQPAPHGLARDARLTGNRGHRRSHGGVLLGVITHEPHAPRAQLGIDLLRHAIHPLGLKQQRHQTPDGSETLRRRGRHRWRPRRA